jgi:tetratricopeptide (TPR) repeat protein
MKKRAAAHAHYAAGVVHELNDEPELALREYQKAALDDPTDETLILDVSQRFLQNRQPEKALELLLAASARPEASGAVLAQLGFIYAVMSKNDLAVEADRTAINKFPREFAGYHNLFLIYLSQGKGEAALTVLDEAARISEPDVEFLTDLAELYVSHALRFPGQREVTRGKAKTALGRAQKQKPDSPQLRLKLADGYYVLGDNEHAAELYLGLLKQAGDLPLVRENARAKLADIYLRASDRKHAVEQLEAMLRDDPTNAQIYYYLAVIAYDEKRWAEAAEQFKKALLFNPDFEEAYYELAGAQIAADQAGEALVTLETARRKFAANFDAEYLTGVALSRQKEYVEAIVHFTDAEIIARGTEPARLTPSFYFELGAAHEQKGNIAEAEKCFHKCLELSPDYADALNYLGYMWAERGVNLEQARELIGKAVKLEPENAAFLDSLGWVLFKLNQPKEALGYILKSVKLLKSPDATVCDHLGDVYAVLNEWDKAREAWRQSLSVEPNEEVQKKLKARETH